MHETIVVELAGRDSVVALLEFIKSTKEKYEFIFSVVQPPSEDQSNSFILDLGEVLKMYVEKSEHKVAGMYYVNNTTEAWFKLNRPTAEFGFTPCVGCHALCHMCRLGLCKKYDTTKILTGERVCHTGKFKANQDAKMLERYDNYFSDVTFIRPLLNMDTESIKTIYEEFCDEIAIPKSTADSFAECYLSGCCTFTDDTIDKALEYFDSVVAKRLDAITDMELLALED